MRKKIAIFILTLLGISVSVDADAIIFTSVGISNNKGYYVDSGIVLLFLPTGFHYESTDKTLSLFSGVYYPNCLGRIGKHEYFCYARLGASNMGYNSEYSYTRVGMTIQVRNKILMNLSYKTISEYDDGSYKSHSVLFGISYIY